MSYTLRDGRIDGVGSSSSAEALCQICFEDISNQSLDQVQRHYDAHYSDPPQDSSTAGSTSKEQRVLSPKQTNGESKGKDKQTWTGKEKDVFWHPKMESPPPKNYTPGLVALLKRCMLKSHAKGQTITGALCHEDAVHVASQFWDKGWGCGYRNFLMACTALMTQTSQPDYIALLDSPLPPGVRNLQSWIESAWAVGYDAEGRQQLRSLINSKRWIGTADLWVALSSRGIPAKLVDFRLKKTDSSLRGDLLINWVVRYFTPERAAGPSTVNERLQGASEIVCTDKMPLILQHRGHSRTIIGFEKNKNGSTNLLIYDPARTIKAHVRNEALSTFYASSRTPPSQSRQTSGIQGQNAPPSIKNFFHTKGHKRKAFERSSPLRGGESSKKARSSGDEDVISVSDSEDTPTKQKKSNELNVSEVIKFFRVAAGQLKHEEYQILYFPLTPALSEKEKNDRKGHIDADVVS